MNDELTPADLRFIITSLDYAKQNFENTRYPTYEMKREKLDYVEKVRAKVSALKRELEAM